MSTINKNLKTNTLEQKIKINITQEFLDKCKFLCRHIPKLEWSGVLFYDIQGSIKDPENMLLTPIDIFFLNIGSSAYTEYNTDNASTGLVDFIFEKDYIELKQGHIHSHNTMNVFFSGTDMKELEDNSSAFNFYLSLIVNNYMEMCAKVSFEGVLQTSKFPYKVKDENGDEYEIGENQLEEKVLFVYNCDITKPEDSDKVSEDFIKQYNKIVNEYNTKKTIVQKAPTTGNKKDYQNWREDSFMHKEFESTSFMAKNSMAHDDSFWEANNSILDDTNSDEVLIEDFGTFLLRLGKPLGPDDDLDALFEDLSATNFNVKDYCSAISERYIELYKEFFPALYVNEESIIANTEVLIDVLEMYETSYVFVKSINKTLTDLVDRMTHYFKNDKKKKK